ncbi:hypothetical protein [Steroidobacter cummioxidans]|uniref:hypothetical protein n=1 Tax=Steroidobacter cummioxidans TaxID=1803913 RepID=UPI0012905EBE|nr:hypothetical protein [Steroidobacter cummioxidans]
MRRVTSTIHCAAWLMLSTSTAFAYEPTTHQVLSQLAAQRSKVYSDPALLPDLGVSVSTSFTLTNILGQAAGTANAGDIIAFGSDLEDYYEKSCNWKNPTTLGWMRVFNHFFDPQHGGRALTVSGAAIGIPSPNWALEDGGDVTTVWGPCAEIGRNQTYSYRQAQDHLYNSLTGQAANYRQQEISITLQTLGHVIHHVQDMAQPQHARNDKHNEPDQAYYEVYTDEFVRTKIPDIIAGSPPYRIPEFPRARQYWVSDTAPAYVGMAEFSSNNYVSYGTNFASSPGGSILPNVLFPYPNAANANGTQKRIEARSITLRYSDNSTDAGPVNVVLGDVYDGNTGAHNSNQILAVASLLDRPSQSALSRRVFKITPVVFEDNYRILLPRAVAFSAGLINHFFAGRLDVTRAASGSGWTIRNLSGETMTGTFALYYEDNAGIRYAINAASWTGTLTANQMTAALPEPPASAAKLIGVFKGTIGAETALTRVAGKVVSFAPPPVACAGTYKMTGGISGLDITREMGSTSGTVQLSFEAYSIKDSLVVNAVNPANTQLATTSGMVSGLHKRTFAFNPATLGTTKARIRIVGSDADTVWNVAMSCPGKSLSAEDFPPSRQVRFDFGSTLSNASGSCQADFYVDDVRIGLAYVSAAGGTSLTASLTQGPGHGAEFRNFSCTSNNNNLLVGSQYTDPSGTVRLQNMNVTGIRYFDVR